MAPHTAGVRTIVVHWAMARESTARCRFPSRPTSGSETWTLANLRHAASPSATTPTVGEPTQISLSLCHGDQNDALGRCIDQRVSTACRLTSGSSGRPTVALRLLLAPLNPVVRR